jgi:hypothetical protein
MMGDLNRADPQTVLGRLKDALGSHADEYTQALRDFLLARTSRVDFEQVARGLLNEENRMYCPHARSLTRSTCLHAYLRTGWVCFLSFFKIIRI